jgi:hypothetical protein
MLNVTNGDDRESLLGMLLPEGSAVVLRSKSGRAIEPAVVLCRPDRLGDITALQDKVYGRIQDKDTFVLTTPQELAESLELDYCIGAFIEDRLIAFTLMVSNRPGRRNLGCAGGDDPLDAVRSVTYDTTFVDPDYTGYGLQRFFIALKDKLALKLGAVEAYATVSPLNTVSLNSMRSSGFVIVDEKRMYGGYGRYILCKPLADLARGCSPIGSPISEDKEGIFEKWNLP